MTFKKVSVDHFHRRFFNFSKGERCSSTPLDYEELKQGNCNQLVNRTFGEYRTIECPQYDYQLLRTCIYDWCDYISSCLNQTSEWTSLCSSQFNWFRPKRFYITASEEAQKGTYIRNLQLRLCYAPHLRSWWRAKSYKFSIRTTEYFCHSENQANQGMNSQRLCSRGWHIVLLKSSIMLFSIGLKRLALDNAGWSRTEQKSCFPMSLTSSSSSRDRNKMAGYGEDRSTSPRDALSFIAMRFILSTSTFLCLQQKPYSAMLISVTRGRRWQFSFGSTSSYVI